MHILLVEDDHIIAKNTKEYLKLCGYTVDWLAHGDAVMSFLDGHRVDLLLLDIMLPGKDGLALCSLIRAKRSLPILFLTAKGQLPDKIAGFDAGADDYMVKPFELAELEARIQAIAKRYSLTGERVRGDVHVVLDSQKVISKGEEVQLPTKEFLLLQYLIKHQGSVVSRTDLIEYLWGGEDIFANDGKLDVYISTLRRKLGKDLITTVKGFGYKIGEKES